MKRAFPILVFLVVAFLGYAAYQALVIAPTEQTMGNVQRIFYYHVPSAWTAFLLFSINFIASVTYLIRRNPSADAIALVSAEVGVVFCTVVLVTGPLWARPVWGIWWTWDARLTSTLVLWLIYVSYLVLRRFSATGQTPVLAAVLAVFGFADVPLVYESNRIFRTQHPQPVIGGGTGTSCASGSFRIVLPSAARNLQFRSRAAGRFLETNCRFLAALGMTNRERLQIETGRATNH